MLTVDPGEDICTEDPETRIREAEAKCVVEEEFLREVLTDLAAPPRKRSKGAALDPELEAGARYGLGRNSGPLPP
jgi:hypothetical protein